jgi:hypothetical protein
MQGKKVNAFQDAQSVRIQFWNMILNFLHDIIKIDRLEFM